MEENHLLIDSLTETIQTLENDNLSQLEIYKQQQEEANIEQSKLLKEKETILKQKEELISNKDILLRQKDTQLQSILEKNGKLEQRMKVCQNSHLLFYAQSPDFHKLGLCYYLKILYL